MKETTPTKINCHNKEKKHNEKNVPTENGYINL